MTNEELATIKSKLVRARCHVYPASIPCIELNEVLDIIDNVQKRAQEFQSNVAIGKGPDCYNCKCRERCERYA